MTITLRRSATCAECGTELQPGTRASWYRNGAVYGLSCHERKSMRKYSRTEPLGLTYSKHDPSGFYTSAGRLIGRVSCGCEDYPCCGH